MLKPAAPSPESSRPQLARKPAFALLGALLVVNLTACAASKRQTAPYQPGLVINEVVSKNEGVWLDEQGEADDYIELFNGGESTVSLGDYLIADKKRSYPLPELPIAPGETLLFWADQTQAQGPLHLPFKIDSDGEALTLGHTSGVIADHVVVPHLDEHAAYQRIPDGTGEFVICNWATPNRKNGGTCGAAQPRVTREDLRYAEYTWPTAFPALPQPLSITELGLRPADFVELRNNSTEAVELRRFQLRLARRVVGSSWPGVSDGVALEWPIPSLEPGATLSLQVPAAALSDVAADAHFEGVASVFSLDSGTTVDRLDFMSWPTGAYFTEYPPQSRRFRFCSNASAGSPNTQCDELTQRPLIDRDRRFLTSGDFQQLAAGSEELGTESVKFIVDLARDSEVTFLSTAWDLHFMFTRQVIDGQPPYDRCSKDGYQRFVEDWATFSDANYSKVESRRYLLGTLVKHASSALNTIEFAPGDFISAEQMKHAFFTVVSRLPDPESWAIRPQPAPSADQTQTVRGVEGSVPIVGPNAPYRDVTFQPLSAAEGFGTLRFVATGDFGTANLGPHDIVVTDGVPLDVPLIGGIVTEALQTPLSHVNVLSRARKTPNMALVDAREDPRFKPYFGKLVHFEVLGSDFTLTPADPDAALAFWRSREPSGMPLVPRVDLVTRGVVPLDLRSFSDLPTVGGKAAQMAELGKVQLCKGSVSTPPRPFAIPVVYSVEHFERSGARALLTELEATSEFAADIAVRDAGLAKVRRKISEAPLDPELHKQVLSALRERWPDQALRFRSSSNVEDLQGFNGAGLYESVGLDADQIPEKLDAAIVSVWASLYRLRAYDERFYYNIDQSQIAMAVLVHPAYPSERVNGVAISRDVRSPSNSVRYYFNTQVGEALVTNPAPGIMSEESSFESGGWLPSEYYGYSTFSPNMPIMTEVERAYLWCNLNAIHTHFRMLLDPQHENGWFAMDIEFKLMGPNRNLVIKQARPYSFGASAPEGWCDFY